MKNIFRTLFVSFSLTVFTSSAKQYSSVNEYPVPVGPLCEMSYSPSSTSFCLWSPAAESVQLSLYKDGFKGSAYKTIDLKRDAEGCWKGIVEGNLIGDFYDFNVKMNGQWRGSTPGIFAKAVGVNGKRGAVIDLKSTNPSGWSDDVRPVLNNPSDLVVYELHLRDFSAASSSGIQHKGKFLSLTEQGCNNGSGANTGIDHLKELGVNAVQILPIFDYGSVDERNLGKNQYNWGYDPVNYNVPEGSYSTNPTDPSVRIREMKMMIHALHQAGIRVIMDVVYNHTFSIDGSNFDLTVPGYFYRYQKDGKPSNASGCGNETASECQMMRKFMVESVCYWVNEYHIDGFRFDLMGIHDIETMNAIRNALDKIDPSITVYGEGWAAGSPALPQHQLAMKSNVRQMSGIGAFGDELRDALRGPFNDDHQGAFLAGLPENEESIKFGIVGAIRHPDVDNTKVNYSKSPWSKQPWQMISYVSCHDDMCLADRLRTELPNISEPELIALDKLAQTAVLTSQGIPFLFAGEEVMRTKKFVHNSFCSPDSINEIDWLNKTKYKDVYQYYRGLIQLRREHPAFRMGNAEAVVQNLSFLKTDIPHVVAFSLNHHANGDSADKIIVVLNAAKTTAPVSVDTGTWRILVKDGEVDTKGKKSIDGGFIVVAPQSALILMR